MSFSSWKGLFAPFTLFTTWPSLLTRNLSKFQPMSWVPTAWLDLRNFHTGCAFGPFTSTLENIGNVTLREEGGDRRQSARDGPRGRATKGLVASPVLGGDELLNRRLVMRLLLAELVAGESQYGEALLPVLVVQGLKVRVLGSETSVGRGVHHQSDLTRES